MTFPRERLLAKATDYYAAHGVRDTSLRTLAAAIGTSQRMLHYHFGSREDLLAAVIEAIAAGEIARLEQLFADTEDPFQAARRNWELIADAAGQWGPLVFELASHAMHGQDYASELTDVLVRRYAAAFAEAFTPVVGAERAARLARLSLAVGRGAVFDLLLDGDRAAADAAVEEFTRLVEASVDRS